jgi:hypothetical protein
MSELKRPLKATSKRALLEGHGTQGMGIFVGWKYIKERFIAHNMRDGAEYLDFASLRAGSMQVGQSLLADRLAVSWLDYGIALPTIALVTKRLEIRQAVAPALRERESVMDLEANANTTGAAPHASKMIAL